MIINVDDGIWPGENMDFDLTKESGDVILPARIEIYLFFWNLPVWDNDWQWSFNN